MSKLLHQSLPMSFTSQYPPMPLVTLLCFFILVVIESILNVLQIHNIYNIKDLSLKLIVRHDELFIFTLRNTNFIAMCSLIINQEYYSIYLMALVKINEIVIRVVIIDLWEYRVVVDTLFIISEVVFILFLWSRWHIIYPLLLANFNERVGSNRTVFRAYTLRNFYKACRFNSFIISTHVTLVVFCAKNYYSVYDYLLLGKLFLYTVEYYFCYEEGEESKKKKVVSILFWFVFAAHSITVSILYFSHESTKGLKQFPHYMYAIFNFLTFLSNIGDYMMYGEGLREALKRAKVDKKSRPFFNKYVSR